MKFFCVVSSQYSLDSCRVLSLFFSAQSHAFRKPRKSAGVGLSGYPWDTPL